MSPRARFAAWALSGTLIATLLTAYAATRFTIGIDVQETRCLPWTVYLIDRHRREAAPGDLVAFAARGLPPFPDGATMIKQVAAVAGDRIEVRAGEVRVNGVPQGALHDGTLMRLGRSAASFEAEYRLGSGQMAFLGTEPASYDSRYYGPIDAPQIIGRVVPLW